MQCSAAIIAQPCRNEQIPTEIFGQFNETICILSLCMVRMIGSFPWAVELSGRHISAAAGASRQ